MVELARPHLATHVRRAADEEDVALAAFAEFCAGAAAGWFPRLSSRHDLWRLLLTLTLRRPGRARNPPAPRPRPDAAAADLLELPAIDLDRLAGNAPDPALAAEVADGLRVLLARMPGDDLRVVARDLLAGCTAPGTARRLGCSPRTVERRWQHIRQFWDAQCGA
jgi:DNA-directed RNA polymerase specialized sigma24 family protein